MGETLKCKYLGIEVQVLSVDTGGAVVNLRKNLHMTGCPVPQSLSTEETAGSISADDALIARSSHSSAIAQKPLEMIQEVMETQKVDPPTSLFGMSYCECGSGIRQVESRVLMDNRGS